MRLLNSSPLSHFYSCYTCMALSSCLCSLWCKISVLLYYHYSHALYDPIPKRLSYCSCPVITCIKIRMYLFQLASSIVVEWDLNKGWGWAIPVVALFLLHLGYVLSWYNTACTQCIIKVWSCCLWKRSGYVYPGYCGHVTAYSCYVDFDLQGSLSLSRFMP